MGLFFSVPFRLHFWVLSHRSEMATAREHEDGVFLFPLCLSRAESRRLGASNLGAKGRLPPLATPKSPLGVASSVRVKPHLRIDAALRTNLTAHREGASHRVRRDVSVPHLCVADEDRDASPFSAETAAPGPSFDHGGRTFPVEGASLSRKRQ